MAEMGVARREPSGWAIGFTAFAGASMVVIGMFQAIIGLTAVFQNEVFVATQEYLFGFDLTTWGWIHLLVGALVLMAGIAVFSGAVWARTIGVIVAMLSAIANFAFLPLYPVWSALIIAVDIGVIWALTAHGSEFSDTA